MPTKKKATRKKATRKKATRKTTTRKKVTRKKATKKTATRKKATRKTTTRKKATRKTTTRKKATKRATATKKATATKRATGKVKAKKKRKPNAAFMKALTPSDDLASIVGSRPLPRTQAVKKIWDHIKKHDLQNPANRRNILSDTLLRKLSGKAEFSMFELAKIVNTNLHN